MKFTLPKGGTPPTGKVIQSTLEWLLIKLEMPDDSLRGPLCIEVMNSQTGMSNEAPVQIATLVDPVYVVTVTESDAPISKNAASVTIRGSGFADSIYGNKVVLTCQEGTPPKTSIESATPTEIVLALADMDNVGIGALYAVC